MQIKLTIPIRMAKTNGQKLDNAKCWCAAGQAAVSQVAGEAAQRSAPLERLAVSSPPVLTV